MRTAIKTYQGGGQFEFDPQGRLVPVQQPTPEVTQERPAQPSPGASGQTTPAVPLPSQAIDTSGLVKTVPEPELKTPDDDMNIWRSREEFNFDPNNPERANVLSHRGSFKPLLQELDPSQFDIKYHSEYPQLQEAQAILDKYQNNPAYLKQTKIDAKVKTMEARMRHDQYLKFRAAHDKVKEQFAQEVRGLDEKPLPESQESRLDEDIKQSLANYDSTKFLKNPAIQTPQDQHDADEQRAASPLMTMPPDKLNAVIRNLVYLNRGKINVGDAVQIAMMMGSPVKPGAEAYNGLRGKAAARFQPHGVDAIDNRVVKLQDGRIIRMSENTYDLLDQFRMKGYDAAEAARTKLQKAREEEQKLGVTGRVLKGVGLQ